MTRLSLFWIGIRTQMRRILRRRVFFDYAAGIPEGTGFWKLVPFWSRVWMFFRSYGNPESIHRAGVRSKKAVGEARIKVARFFGVAANHVLFTRGGTESVSVFLQGAVLRWKKDHPGMVPIVITSALEHSAVYETIRVLEERGEVEIVYLPVHPSGITDSSSLMSLLSDRVVLVTCMLVNNELGTLQPVREIGRSIKAYKGIHPSLYPLFHIDAIQAAPYSDCAPSHYYADAVSLGGSKLGVGPSVGALAVLNASLLDPVILGGRQEKGLFPGSVDAKSVAKLGLVLEAISKNQERYLRKLSELREYFVSQLEMIPGISIFDSKNAQAPHIITAWIPNTTGEEMVIKLDSRGICASPQAACSDPARDSRIVREVMKARGMKEDVAVGQVRFSLGLLTTRRDIRKAIRTLRELV